MNMGVSMIQDPAGWRIKQAGDNVLLLVGFGAWEPQDARRFCLEYRDTVSGFSDRPWAILGDATDWILEDRVVKDILRDHNRWIVEAGCRAGSFYTGSGALNRLLLYRLAEPDSEEFSFRVHPHRRRAVEALVENGFTISEDQINSFFRGEGTRD